MIRALTLVAAAAIAGAAAVGVAIVRDVRLDDVDDRLRCLEAALRHGDVLGRLADLERAGGVLGFAVAGVGIVDPRDVSTIRPIPSLREQARRTDR